MCSPFSEKLLGRYINNIFHNGLQIWCFKNVSFDSLPNLPPSENLTKTGLLHSATFTGYCTYRAQKSAANFTHSPKPVSFHWLLGSKSLDFIYGAFRIGCFQTLVVVSKCKIRYNAWLKSRTAWIQSSNTRSKLGCLTSERASKPFEQSTSTVFVKVSGRVQISLNYSCLWDLWMDWRNPSPSIYSPSCQKTSPTSVVDFYTEKTVLSQLQVELRS